METKEAIEFLDKKNRYVCPKTNQEVEHNDEIDEVISLLQQGEKYRQMWGELEDQYETKGTEYFWKLISIMGGIEQKYFPKSIKREKMI